MGQYLYPFAQMGPKVVVECLAQLLCETGQDGVHVNAGCLCDMNIATFSQPRTSSGLLALDIADIKHLNELGAGPWIS
jgi:hypothetical protein